jgi:hypothetical protein
MESPGRPASPYDDRPDRALWKRSVAGVPSGELDPYAPPKFAIDPAAPTASAGSCFARHIAANLKARGFNFLSTEPGSEYSARFGNVYTTLQLVQLFERAYGTFSPADAAWPRGDVIVDALRPRAFDEGFASIADLEAERERHLAAVRAMFEQLEVFVFTLGLTETFVSRIDGTAYPACPGKDFGEFDPQRYAFRNLGVAENLEAMHRFIAGLRGVNPRARVLLTVSPVPLVATMEDRSVIVSTVYSKSVLRVVADELRRAYEFVDYFWSYEIITSTFNTSRYFDAGRRNVTDAGVRHVMRSFFRHFAQLDVDESTSASDDPCDEDVLYALIKEASQ